MTKGRWGGTGRSDPRGYASLYLSLSHPRTIISPCQSPGPKRRYISATSDHPWTFSVCVIVIIYTRVIFFETIFFSSLKLHVRHLPPPPPRRRTLDHRLLFFFFLLFPNSENHEYRILYTTDTYTTYL